MMNFADKIKARTDGSLCRQRGLTRNDCPYVDGDELRAEWLAGYDGEGELLAKVFPAAGGPLRGGEPA